jgi:hypothetical protein
MAKSKYDKYFIQGPKPVETEEFYKHSTAHLDGEVIKDSYYFLMTFMWPEISIRINNAHTHTCPEVLLWHGIDPDDPYDLGAELEIHMGPEFELYTINQTVLLYVPTGFPHCPILYRMRKASLHAYTFPVPLFNHEEYTKNIKQEGVFERKYGHYFLKGPKLGDNREFYRNCTTYLDGDVIKGSNYFFTTFISKANPLPEPGPISSPYGKIMGFFGTKPESKFDLGAEIEFGMGDEMERRTINESLMVYIPPNTAHCMIKQKINRPFLYLECAQSPKITDIPCKSI